MDTIVYISNHLAPLNMYLYLIGIFHAKTATLAPMPFYVAILAE